jgi:hypothetical protein
MAQPPVPAYPPAQRNRFRRAGCILLLISLLLFLSAAGYLLVEFLGTHLPGSGIGQPSITTIPLQIAFAYKGADITIVDARQSKSFIDDPNTATDGMLRLSLHESNATPVNIAWSYPDVAELILPGKPAVHPTYAPAPVDLAPGKAQSSIVDFAVSSSQSITRLTLRIGSTNEAQEDIVLSGKADSGAFLPQTASLKGSLQYFGLNYTLKSVTTSLFMPGQQAARGMRYVSLTLSVDNTLSQQAIPGSPFEYARIRYGNASASPVDTSIPVSFNAGVLGVTGTITFLLPQKSTAYTLVFVSQQQDSGDQASANFSLA